MLRKATATAFCMLFLGHSIPASLATDERSTRSETIQIAQASPVTKFRGLFIGMNRAELEAAASAIGASVEPETLTIFSEKTGENKTEVVPNKFKIRRGFVIANISFGSANTIEEMTLLKRFFEISSDISVREFSQKLANAYGVRQMRYERITIPYIGTFWGFRGETSTGERLTILDGGDGQASSVDITKSAGGTF